VNGQDSIPNGPSFYGHAGAARLKLESTRAPVDVLVVDRVDGRAASAPGEA
jgi:hypothetical protein